MTENGDIEKVCLFKEVLHTCSIHKKDEIVLISEERLKSVLNCSHQRKDLLSSYTKIKDGHQLFSHKSCLSTYTSATHIKRYVNKRKASCQLELPSQPKVSLRSSAKDSFDFNIHCLFCGNECQMTPDPKNPNRWNKTTLCRTADRGKGNKTFKEVVLDACEKRNDNLAHQVSIRVQGAVSDLHASNGRYHDKCKNSFMAPRSIASASKTNIDKTHDEAFSKLVKSMIADESHIWSSIELHKIYSEFGGSITRKHLISKIEEHFGETLLPLSSPGLATMFLFTKHASSIMRFDKEEDSITEVTSVAKMINKEIKEIPFDKTRYNINIDLESAIKECSPTLLALLTELSPTFQNSLPAVLIGNMVTSSIAKRYTSLQISLGVLLREKVIEHFYKYNVSCSYNEVRRFKTSAAVACKDTQPMDVLSDHKNGLVQVVADNFDVNISSQNGLKQTHSLAMLLAQTKREEDNEGCGYILRLKKYDMKDSVLEDVPIHYYKGPKKTPMPDNEATRHVLPLKVLAQKVLLSHYSEDKDFQFLKDITSKPNVPEYSGYNTKWVRESGQSKKRRTTVMYTPMIDRKPADHSTMLSAVKQSIHLTKQTGQTFTVFTADQQLYKLLIDIMWVYPELCNDFYSRLGGMHWLTSFVGSIGTLMMNTGLEDVLKKAFASVPKMLTGKLFPMNVRALRLVVEELLSSHISEIQSYNDLSTYLDDISTKSLTAKLWIDNLIKPVLLIMKFVRAEREGEWALHLEACERMLPYFFAAGHANYARYGLYYLRSMEKLPKNLLDFFLKGEHVMRHQEGYWNGIWSDMLIETTFMKYGKGPGGLVGVTLEPKTMKIWALSLHTCSTLLGDLDNIESTSDKGKEKHKEESASRIKSDEIDRCKIREALKLCIDPLAYMNIPSDSLVNIYSGKIASKKVNVYDSVDIGRSQMKEFAEKWPEGFYDSITKKVTTMALSKKSIQVNDVLVYDTEVIFSRIMCLLSTGDINLHEVLGNYELSPIPTSIFDDEGNARFPKNKSVLKNKLKVDISKRMQPPPTAVILDGCALLWTLPWPDKGKVQDVVNLFVAGMLQWLTASDVYLIFDRYYDYSIKSSTRQERSKSILKERKLILTTPLPSQSDMLSSTSNKKQLINMIRDALMEKLVLEGNPNRFVVTTFDQVPDLIQSGKLEKHHELWNSFEEADNIIVHQLCFIVGEGANCVKVVCDDTDVFVLLMHFYHTERFSANILMEATSGERTVVSIGETVKLHEPIVPYVLAGHAISGCDSVSSFFNIGKLTMLNVLKKFPLNFLGELNCEREVMFKEAKAFIAACYGVLGEYDFSITRYKCWKAKTLKGSLSTRFKLCTLPPTNEVAELHILRAHFQAMLWKQSANHEPPNWDPTEYGWTKDVQTKSLFPTMFPPLAKPLPDNVLKLISCNCQASKCATHACSCGKMQMSCSEFCACKKETCLSKWTIGEVNRDEESEDET